MRREFAPAAVPAEPAAHSDRLSAGELPLAGMRIVESSRRVQGPMATRLLSLLGAEIIRIEPPGGDPLRGIPPMAGDVSARFVALNHAKRIVEIDIKDPAGQRSVLELVRDADVFLHNWAPGKAAQFGLDAEHMHEVNPRLVYAYASGWGSALGERPPLGTDFMVQAHAGVADAVTPDGEDRHPSLMTLLDVLGGFVAAEESSPASSRCGATARAAASTRRCCRPRRRCWRSGSPGRTPNPPHWTRFSGPPTDCSRSAPTRRRSSA
ncbi:CoA transferase [Saccharopolyspora spinosporotrichia]